MRTDMHKVVVERPRWNPGPGKNGRRANLPDELLPKFEGIKRPHSRRKGLTDLLGPLRRWLHAQLGRPWNEVYSAAAAVIKPDSSIRAHIKTHLLEFVERHTFMHDGKVCVIQPNYRGGGIVPVTELRHRRSSFFVHPETFLLCEIPVRPRHRWRDKNAARRELTQRWLDETTLLRRLNGCWFECRVEKFPARFAKGQSPWQSDLAEKKLICRSGATAIYGGNFYCIAKRQLSRRELQKFGVSNHHAERSLQPVITVSGWRLRSAVSALRVHRRFPTTTLNPEAVWQTHRSIKTARFFEITRKRRQGFPSETRVQRGDRVVHGDKELREKLGRNDPCPCGSGRSFQKLLPPLRQT